jgi:hypothetical protein
MLQFLKNLFLHFRFQIAFLDLSDLAHCPGGKFLHLTPPLIHRLGVEDYDDELELVAL